MKSWHSIALYCISTVALLLLLNSYISNSTMYTGKAKKIDRLYQELEQQDSHGKAITLVIGNSYVEASFQENLAGEEFFKFSVAAMPLDDIIHLLKNTPKHININRAIVGLGYNYITPVTSNSYIYKKYTASNIISRSFWSIPFIRAYSLSSTIIKEDIKCILNQQQGNHCNNNNKATKTAQKNSNRAPSNHDTVTRTNMDKSIKQRLEEYGVSTSVLSIQFKKKLDQLKDICNERNIKLIAYTAPIIKGVREELNKTILEQFRAEIKNSVTAYTDLNLVFPDWDYTKFKDATHIKDGKVREVTTNYLIHFIEIQ